MVRWVWEASDGANRGCCSVDATLAVEGTFPTRGPRHEADVFYWCNTTEASKDHHQLRKCVRGALFCSGAAQVCHDDRVVELKEQLEVEEEDGNRQEEEVEEKGRSRIKENAP